MKYVVTDEKAIELFEAAISADPERYLVPGETVYQITRDEVLAFVTDVLTHAKTLGDPVAEKRSSPEHQTEMLLARMVVNEVVVPQAPEGDKTLGDPTSESTCKHPLHVDPNYPEIPEGSTLGEPVAMPDSMDPLSAQPEGLNYADGWNACREAMLSAAPHHPTTEKGCE